MSWPLVHWLILTAASQATPPVPMVGGETTSAHPAVGALVVCSGERCATFCSGTLVDSGWVLTAGHCVEAILEDYRGLDIAFALGEDVLWADGRDAMDQVSAGLLHPRYGDMQHDIGLVKLLHGLDAITQPVVSSPPTEAWLDTPLRYVGYGVTSDSADDAGVKRRADIPLQAWDDQWLMAEDPEGATNLCWGDSGGAAMLPLEGGGWALVGVQSWIWDDDDTPCTGGSSGAARVDAHLDWLTDEAPMDTVVIVEDQPDEDEGPEGEDGAGDDDEDHEDQTDDDNQDDTGQDDDEEHGPERNAVPSGAQQPGWDDTSTNSGFQRAASGCHTGAGRGPLWLSGLLALMVGVLPRRRRA